MASKKTGLGRGIESLIPQDFDHDILLAKHERIQNISISSIEPNKDQPRKEFDRTAIAELSASIKTHGVLQPIIITEIGQGKYQVVAGQRRWLSAKAAGLKSIPSIIRTIKDQEKMEIALIENVQRVDLSPIEEAASIEYLRQQFNLSYDEIAKRLGKASSTIKNIVRLLQLPETARLALQKGEISEGHARTILSLKDNEARQAELLSNIKRHKWSVRQAERFVVGDREGKSTPKAIKEHMSSQTAATKSLGKKLGSTITIKRMAHGGKLELSFNNDQQLKILIDRLLEKL